MHKIHSKSQFLLIIFFLKVPFMVEFVLSSYTFNLCFVFLNLQHIFSFIIITIIIFNILLIQEKNFKKLF